MNGPHFLHVLIQVRVDGAFRTALEVFQKKRTFCAYASYECEVAAVRGRRWSNRTTGTRHETLGDAGLQVMSPNLEDLTVRILCVLKGGAGCTVEAEINIAAIGRVGRLTKFFLMRFAGPFDDSDSVTTVAMVDPDFSGSERTAGREMFTRRDVIAVRRPPRVIQ